MSEDLCKRFANSVRIIVPDFPLTNYEIQEVLEEQGLAGLADADVAAEELMELSELLEQMERRE
jgi:hypothetical protein